MVSMVTVEIENSEVWLAWADWAGVTSPSLYSTTTAPVPPTVRDTGDTMHYSINNGDANASGWKNFMELQPSSTIDL